MRYVVFLVAAAACGRVDFDAIGDAGTSPGDAGAGSDAMPGDFMATTPVHLASPAGWYGSITSAGGVYGIAYADFPTGTGQSHLLRVDTTGQVVSATTASASTTDAHESTVAWTGSEYIAAWSDARSGSLQIYGARFSAMGTKLTTDLPLSTAGTTNNESPHLFFDGSGLALVYSVTGSYAFRFAYLDATLNVTADVAIAPASTLIQGGAAGDPSEYGIASSTLAGAATFSRRTTAGAQIGTPLTLSTTSDGTASVAATTSGYEVAWATDNALHVTSIPTSGTPDDHMIGTGRQAVVASHGDRVGIAWVAMSAPKIQFAELDASGALVSPVIAISAASETGAELPSITWDGTGYAIAWDDGLGGDGLRFARVFRP